MSPLDRIRKRSARDLAIAAIPSALLLAIAVIVALHYTDPAPSDRIVISAGGDEGNYEYYAKQYQEILKDEGVKVEIRSSKGGLENLKKVADPHSDVDVAFIQDGVGSAAKAPNVSSLGSLYYEPLWTFYRRGRAPITRFSQLTGKRLAIGAHGQGVRVLTKRMLRASGVDEKTAQFLDVGNDEAIEALKSGRADAAFFVATADNEFIRKQVADPGLKLMSVDQAEAITRQAPYLHHLVLPHGALDLKNNLPDRDVDLVAPTATLVARDSMHPALIYLLLKAASQVHGDPGIFERKNEFPTDKDYEFPLDDDAQRYYKSGMPFWQRYLPFWFATMVDRFIVVALPLLALLLPLLRAIPRVYQWRIKSRIYQRYGELKFLETQMAEETDRRKCAEHLKQLDAIEERVNRMKIPLDHSEYVYALRQNIEFVRGKLRQSWPEA